MQGGGTGSAGNGPRALEPKHLLTVLLRGRMATGASFLCRHQQPLQCQSRRLLLPLCTARRLLLPPAAPVHSSEVSPPSWGCRLGDVAEGQPGSWGGEV